uniref:GLOBIN domain-containing protein n=1 Tax=Rhabditophanes sp. KR3021 TaxID=114890 RepID=A0AC35UI21_9BILA
MGQSESKSETERAIPLKKRTQSAEGKARHHVTGSNHKHITRKSTSNLVNEIDSIEDSGCSSNGSGSLQSSVKTGRCMHHPTVEQNDISKQSSKKELLTKRQKILLRGSWNKCQRSGLDNIGAVIFTKIYILDPTVGHMFDLYNVPIPDLKYKKFFQSHAMTFTRSLDFCIQNMDNMDTIVEYFYQLGRRHVKYKKLGFKPHYWDIFSEALTEAVIEYECGFKHRDVLKGWRTLITFIIEQMREGYLDENKSLLKKDHTSSTDGMNSITEKCEDTVHKSFNNYFHIDDALAKDQTSCPSEPYYQHHFKNSRFTMPPKRITKRFSMPADHDFSEEQDITLSHPVQVYLQEPVEEINNLPTREPHIAKQMKRSQQKNSKKCLMPQNFFELAVPTIREEESPEPKRVRYTYSKDPEDYKETNDAGCHHLNENYQVSSNEFHYHSAYDEPLSVHVNNSEEEVRQLLPVQLLSHIKSTNKSDVLPKTTDSPDKSRMYRDCVEAACDLFKEETDQVFLKDLAHFKYMKKTSMPYSLYIGLVLSNIDTYAISVADIYKSIIFMFPHMEFEAEISWRSSIRHTIISKKNYFDKIAKLDATEKGVCNYRLKCAFDFTKHGLNEPAVVAEYKNSMRFPELFEKLIIGECKVFPPEDDRISRILEHIYEPVKIQNYFECRLRMKILISRIGTKSLCEPKNPTKKKIPKKTFNLIDPNTIHLEKEFTKYAAVIEHFFRKLIEVEKLDTIKYETMCIALGKRHCDFLLKGFHVTHWTVFHNCILDVIGETILQAFPNERKQSQIQVSWTRFIARIIQLMQVGFKEEQQARANNCPKQIDNHNCGNKSM